MYLKTLFKVLISLNYIIQIQGLLDIVFMSYK